MTLMDSSFSYFVDVLNSDSLVASEALGGDHDRASLPLPNNQWQIEVERWMAIFMSNVQRMFVGSVTGPTNKDLLEDWVYATSETFVSIYGSDVAALIIQSCKAQKIRSNAYQSFSILGLATNFGLGGILILMGLTMKYIIPIVQNRRARSRIARVKAQAWALDSVLQLQRHVYAKLSLGDWEGEDSYPTTTTNTTTIAGQAFVRPTFLEESGVIVSFGVPCDAAVTRIQHDRSSGSAAETENESLPSTPLRGTGSSSDISTTEGDHPEANTAHNRSVNPEKADGSTPDVVDSTNK